MWCFWICLTATAMKYMYYNACIHQRGCTCDLLFSDIFNRLLIFGDLGNVFDSMRDCHIW